MTAETPIVTVFGGSGFVGRYISRRLVDTGWLVRVAVRSPEKVAGVFGENDQISAVKANIQDDNSTAEAVSGAKAVINCVGILFNAGSNSFDTVQSEGAARIARLAADAGVERFVQISAIGADAGSAAAYARTKAEGEQSVLAAFPGAVILRPSIVFGPEDGFFNRFAEMSKVSPALPVVGPQTKFQPVYVDDVAAAAVKAVVEDVEPGIYELGGPEVATFKALMQKMLGIIGRQRALVALPFWAAKIQGSVLDLLPKITFGSVPNSLLTKDQVLLLERDNVVSAGAKTFADLGITPRPMDGIIDEYLAAYRPGGKKPSGSGQANTAS